MRRSALLGALGAVATALATTTLATTPHAGADDLPPGPPLHHVQYTVTADAPFYVNIYYRDTDPPSWSDYSHNPYEFSPRAEATVGPGQPWIFDANLADPNLWAMVVVQSGEAPTLAPPTINCTLSVDGTVIKTNSGPKGAICSIRNWY